MQNMEADSRPAQERALKELQYVTFLVDEETYGLAVSRVKEIISMIDITHVPNTASFMEGVINLRGIVVPVISMRKKFRLEPKAYDRNTVIIIIEAEDRLIGAIVDFVSDVLDIPAESIQSTPTFNTRIEIDFIQGIGRVDKKMIIILDADKILSAEEKKSVDTAGSAR